MNSPPKIAQSVPTRDKAILWATSNDDDETSPMDLPQFMLCQLKQYYTLKVWLVLTLWLDSM